MMTTLFAAAALAASCAAATPETWEIEIHAAVPRVYDNAESLGFRKFEWQKLRGAFTVARNDDGEPSVSFVALSNMTHKVNGKPVSYDVGVLDVQWHGIGSNSTKVFDTRSVTLSIIAEPNYAVGPAPTDDNSLILTLAGYGKVNTLKGYAAGQMGCACAEYGHVSPTRIWCTPVVTDTASSFGRWKARRMASK